MKRIVRVLTIIIFAAVTPSAAQEKGWTLEECIRYAIENNIGLQRQRLQTESAEVNALKSKMDMLPSLNFGSDSRVGFGRSIDPVTNLITFEQNFSNSYSLNSSITLFNGFNTLNTVAANRYMVKAGLEREKVVRNNLILDIMGQYYQVLYTKGLEDASRQQLDNSEKQLFRVTRMVETGKEALAKQYEIESQVSADRLTYTVAKNSSRQALTTLKQMLQLEPGSDFGILYPDPESILISDSSYRSDSIYSVAAENLPRLRLIEYELRASEKQLAASRGLVAPSLSVGGAIFTGYYRVLSGAMADQISYASQLKNNNSQALFLSLNVPLFNNYSARRTIRQARITRNDTELKLALEKNNLYTEIENACLNYNSSKDEYAAAAANLTYTRKSFNAMEKRFESGLIDVTDYAAAKTTLFRAETELLRTRLQLLIRKLSIQFYSTGEYENTVN